jgi:hypothetical protein
VMFSLILFRVENETGSEFSDFIAKNIYTHLFFKIP